MGDSRPPRENAALWRIRAVDPEVDERIIVAVFQEAGGWNVFAESGSGNVRLVWVPAQPVRPRVGDRLRIYGQRRLRGLDINDQPIFYGLPETWETALFSFDKRPVSR